LSRRARAASVMLIWRAQARTTRHVMIRKGRTENTSVGSTSGHGIQVYTGEGYTAMSSRDDFRPEPAIDLLGQVIRAASTGRVLDLHATAISDLTPVTDRAIPDRHLEFQRIDLSSVANRLVEVENDLAAMVPGVGLRLSFSADLDTWRVIRSDGTDVMFAMPRCNLALRASTENGDGRHSITITLHNADPGCPWDERFCDMFIKRAKRAASLARDLPDAPNHPPGSYPLVIDYALAKGLAHEAFGHAAEADSYRSSVLAREGKFRAGDEVGASHVSIIDEPIPGDHAWQPFSANGLRRDRVVIVEKGKLVDGLSDPWSAAPGGVRLTGAARAESFRNAPVPRMSNIRIEIDGAAPAPGEFEDYTPERVRDLLATSGVFRKHREVVFLSGYNGGQVNTATGDFVFNCKAIYRLSEKGTVLFRPAIFSGSMFGALRSIREAFGPLRLDAVGFCGKWGQTVPSSGGSHYFLMLDPDRTVRLGGS